MKFSAFIFFIFLTSQAFGDDQEKECYDPLRIIFFDYRLMLTVGDINSDITNPDAQYLNLDSIFSLEKLSNSAKRGLCKELSNEEANNRKISKTEVFAPIFGVLGGSLGKSIGRSVTGDPTFMIGYSSETAIDPADIQDQIDEKLNSGAPMFKAVMTSTISLELSSSLSSAAKKRFGGLSRVELDKNMAIKKIHFNNLTFTRDKETNNYSGKEANGHELKIVLPSFCFDTAAY